MDVRVILGVIAIILIFLALYCIEKDEEIFMYIGCILYLLFLSLKIFSVIFLISKLFCGSGISKAVLMLVILIM